MAAPTIVDAMLAHPVDGPKGGGEEAPAAHPIGDRDEMEDMLAEVDLLGMVRADTGEQGRKSGDRIHFGKCPICGHRDCFRYYPKTNSWTCFGASNPTGYEGGSALEYYKATREDSDVEAVKWLRTATGHAYTVTATTATPAVQTATQDGTGLLLPPWEHVRAIDPPKRNPPLVHGILRRGHVALLAGKGKSGKSWAAIQLSIAVATGGEWFGWKCEQGRVLYIDPELDRKSLDNRFATVCDALGINRAKVESEVAKWSLRGVAGANMHAIINDLDVRGDRFGLVILDSASCFVDGDESAAGEVRRFSALVLQVAAITGGAVLLVHHYGKGNPGDRDAADRARGSSVWFDFPDAPLTLTEVFPPDGDPADHLADGERAFVLESGGLREFPTIQPKRVIFGYPVHRLDVDGLTSEWKPRSGQQDGGRRRAEQQARDRKVKAAEALDRLSAHFIREGIGAEGLPLKAAAELCGCQPRTLEGYLGEYRTFDLYEKSPRNRLVVPASPPPQPQPRLPSQVD